MISVDFIVVFIIGACIGSFLNVCIYRVPAGQSIVFPRSRCRCGATIPFWKNVPILAWLFLRGRASCCGQRIPIRYLIVESLTAILFVAIFAVRDSMENFVICCIFCSLLLVIAFIDIDTMEIYDAMSIGGMCLGIIISLLCPGWHGGSSAAYSLLDSLWGIFFGSGLIFWVAAIGELFFKKEAMGVGDIKLMGTIGAFLGWKGCLCAIFGGCLASSIVLLPIIIILRLVRGKKFRLRHEIPFAPFLVVGSIMYVLCWEELCWLLW
jgi:leader peptidase (prepilin peptidase)/N-methyltransferase